MTNEKDEEKWQDGYLTALKNGKFSEDSVWLDGYCAGVEKKIQSKEEFEPYHISIGADHGGFHLKEKLKKYISEDLKLSIVDFGSHKYDQNDDYPDFASFVCTDVSACEILHTKPAKGILICGTGVGMCVSANKKNTLIRAAVGNDIRVAKQCVEHGNCNVICFGANLIDFEQCKKNLLIFLSSSFSNETRHLRRLEKIKRYHD